MIAFETHATSLDNEAGLASGHFDVDLSPAGEAQARELGRRYRDKLPSLVLTSDLRRAWRTALLAFGEAVPLRRDARLRECDYGSLTRQPARDIEEVRLRHLAVPFPGGESYADAVERVERLLVEIAERDHPMLLIIGHRATFYALEHLLRGRPLAEVVAAPWCWKAGWCYDWPR
jgi:broad specificity phosphatase PhoE